MPDPSTHRSSASDHRVRRGPSRWAIVTVAVLVASVAGVLLVDVVGVFDRRAEGSVTIDGPIRAVVIEVDSGRVRVTEAADRRTDVVTVDRSWSWRFREPAAHHSVVDGEVRLVSRCPGSLPALGRCRVNHHVEVPVGVPVEVRSGGASVVVDGVGSTVLVATSGGVVRGAALSGDEVVVRSAGGDVSLEFADPPSRVEVTSAGGDVEVVVPGGPYDLQVTSSGAPVEVDIAARAYAEPTITVASDGGAVAVRSPEDRDDDDASR
jgi:hypothetical protein